MMEKLIEETLHKKQVEVQTKIGEQKDQPN